MQFLSIFLTLRFCVPDGLADDGYHSEYDMKRNLLSVRALVFLLSAVLLSGGIAASSGILPVSAAAIPEAAVTVDNGGKEFGWYFKKNDTNTQPPLDSQMKFVKQYNAWYIDPAHGDDNAEKVLYLTFDAGYSNANLISILDTLRDEQVPGAFFVLKHTVEANPDLIRRMAAEGHTVCNHTLHHKNMAGLGGEDLAGELTGLETLCRELTGIDMAKYYRPPEGRFSEDNLKQTQQMGYATIFWSFAYADWDNGKQPDPAWAKAHILKHTHNGAVILLHPTSATNAKILPDLIAEWKEQGYRFGTLDELTGQK